MNRSTSWLRRGAGALWRKLPIPLDWHDPYARMSRFLARSDRWGTEQVVEWQLRELNRLLRHAQTHCAGHKHKLRAAGFDGTITRLQDIAELPFLSKDELRADGAEFAARYFGSGSLLAVTSGGTTGAPTRFMVQARSYHRVFDAWRHAMWRRAGFTPGRPCLDVTWAFTDGAPLRKSSAQDLFYLSIHALDAGAIGNWWRRICAFGPEFIIGFPSTATMLAKMAPEQLPSVRALLLASEKLTLDQRSVLSAIFPHARIFQWYGMSEMAGFASGCEHADAFHHWPQSGVIEVIGDDGRPIDCPGEAGEIVLTGFLNHATPFIRYRTGDRAVIGANCRHCLRAHVVLADIEGRVTDFLLGKHGRVVPASALNFHSDEFRRVLAHQFTQDEPGRVVLQVVPLPEFSSGDSAAIIRLMKQKLGEDIDLVFEQVTSIPRTPRGKQPLIVQRSPQHHVIPDAHAVQSPQ